MRLAVERHARDAEDGRGKTKQKSISFSTETHREGPIEDPTDFSRLAEADRNGWTRKRGVVPRGEHDARRVVLREGREHHFGAVRPPGEAAPLEEPRGRGTGSGAPHDVGASEESRRRVAARGQAHEALDVVAKEPPPPRAPDLVWLLVPRPGRTPPPEPLRGPPCPARHDAPLALLAVVAALGDGFAPARLDVEPVDTASQPHLGEGHDGTGIVGKGTALARGANREKDRHFRRPAQLRDLVEKNEVRRSLSSLMSPSSSGRRRGLRGAQ